MIATLLECEIICDGHYIAREDTLHGMRLTCKDGSSATVRHWQDPFSSADMWALDVWDTFGVLSVSANSRKVADAISLEAEEDAAMIYNLLDIVCSALRFGWWTYAVVVWDRVDECLKLVHREDAEDYGPVVLDVRSLRGKKYDEQG